MVSTDSKQLKDSTSAQEASKVNSPRRNNIRAQVNSKVREPGILPTLVNSTAATIKFSIATPILSSL